MKPLEKLVVLDLTRVLAGPYSAMMMGDFGADIIKIEQPEVGDDSRAYGPFIGKESAYFMSLNRNKKSMTLNFKEPAAKELFKRMVAKADIVLENYRPGTMEGFGLGYEVLKEINPRLIYAACSGFGATGPYSQKPAYDVIVQAMGGIMSITGPEGGEPTRPGASIGDIIAGLFTTIGVTMALYHRAMTGEGQKIDVAMLDCQVAVLENAISRYFVNGVAPGPLGNRHPSITPFETFSAKDGYLIVGAGNDRIWVKLCNLLGRDELITDPRFITNADRTKNHVPLKVILDEELKKKTIDEWMTLLEEARIPCAPINTIDKVVTDPQILAREMIVEIEHPVAGKMHIPGVPIKMSATPGAIDAPAPLLGQHTDEILKEFGLSQEEIEDLRTKKAI